MSRVALLVVLLAASAPAGAQEQTPTWPEGGRRVADWISTGEVATQIGAALVTDWRSGDRAHLLKRDAGRIVATFLAAEVVKHVVHRTRPDGSDRMSFYSEHTALAVASSGWSLTIGVPISISTGYFRMAANKHFPTDVMVGSFAGAAVAALIR